MWLIGSAGNVSGNILQLSARYPCQRIGENNQLIQRFSQCNIHLMAAWRRKRQI